MFYIDQDRCGIIYFTDSDLPSLTGSDKQISWAKDIRKGRGSFLASQAETIWENAINAEKVERTPENRQKFLETINIKYAAEFVDNTAAKYWIDRYR